MTDKIKVLFVEDEIDIREAISDILISEGFEVLQAEDGKVGLEMFLEHNSDIIISDVMMPNMNGYDLIKSIRNNHDINNSNVPFIFLTALGQKENILEGVNLEANDYLVKPVDFDLLIAKIKEKVSAARKYKEGEKKNINNLKNQVSNLVPQEMLQYVNMINQISGVLKTEIYGPLPHRKYLEDINKIYNHSLKLSTVVNNFLSAQTISSQLDIADEIINPVALIDKFISGLNKNFQSKVTISNYISQSLPDIKINQNVILEVVKKVVGSVFKIDIHSDIEINIISDHMDRIMIIFYPGKNIDENILRSNIEGVVLEKTLDSQGLLLEVSSGSGGANVMLAIPNYRVIKK